MMSKISSVIFIRMSLAFSVFSLTFEMLLAMKKVIAIITNIVPIPETNETPI